MRSLRFNHIFFALLSFCAASAFLLPRFVDPARAQVQNIFFPISRPARLTAQWARAQFNHQRIADPTSPDHPRSDGEIRQENIELRQTVDWLTAQVQRLQERETQREQLGTLRDKCTPFTITGGDSGTRKTLVISGTSMDGLHSGMIVIFPGGLAGDLLTPGLTGTRVRLITEPGFWMTGIFKRMQKLPNGKTAYLPVSKEQYLVHGIGENTMLVDQLPLAVAQKIDVNDWLMLDDNDRPPAAQGLHIGRVTSAYVPSRRYPGYYQVPLQPAADLMQLHEVMVLTKEK